MSDGVKKTNCVYSFFEQVTNYKVLDKHVKIIRYSLKGQYSPRTV